MSVITLLLCEVQDVIGVCDGEEVISVCGEQVALDATDAQQARDVAAQQGWTYTDADRCPRHSGSQGPRLRVFSDDELTGRAPRTADA